MLGRSESTPGAAWRGFLLTLVSMILLSWFGAPSVRSQLPHRYLSIYMVADLKLYENYQESYDDNFMVNEIKDIYREVEKVMLVNLNITTTLIGLEILNLKSPIYYADTQKFSARTVVWIATNRYGERQEVWETTKEIRRKQLKKVYSDITIVITGFYMKGKAGIALSKAMCTESNSIALVAFPARYYRGLMTIIVTHEIGHQLAMSHDDYDCYCVDGPKKCIMSAGASYGAEKYSNCSIAAYKDYSAEGASCLNEKPKNIKFCGDGLVTGEEQCDCGYFQCDCCDLETCKFRPANSACFASLGICNGKSINCTLPNGELSPFKSCDNGRGVYYNGKCVSPYRQCQETYPTANYSFYDPRRHRIGRGDLLTNAGGYSLHNPKTGGFLLEHYEKVEDDGSCARLMCSAEPYDALGQYYLPNGTLASSETFCTMQSSMMIYQPYADGHTFTDSSGIVRNVPYKMMFPVLVDDGTPCVTSAGQRGYCKKSIKTTNDANNFSYYVTKCTTLN